jgi:hypothetical protein
MVVASVVGVALLIVVMIILTWVAIFGGVGAAIASSYGKSPVIGFAFGSLLGPLGWLFTWFSGRRNGYRAQPDFIRNSAGDLDAPIGTTVPIDTRDDWFGDD